MFYEEEYQEYYEEPDYEAFERIQLDRDRDAGEYDIDPYREPEEVFYGLDEVDLILDIEEVGDYE